MTDYKKMILDYLEENKKDSKKYQNAGLNDSNGNLYYTLLDFIAYLKAIGYFKED